MQPFSISEMRESLRSKTLSSLHRSENRGRGLSASMPCQRVTTAQVLTARKPLHLKNTTAPKTADSIDGLRAKIKEMEEERSAFSQEGVFDLVELISSGNENEQVKRLVEDLQRENRILANALKVVANACSLTPIFDDENSMKLAKQILAKFSPS